MAAFLLFLPRQPIFLSKDTFSHDVFQCPGVFSPRMDCLFPDELCAAILFVLRSNMSYDQRWIGGLDKDSRRLSFNNNKPQALGWRYLTIASTGDMWSSEDFINTPLSCALPLEYVTFYPYQVLDNWTRPLLDYLMNSRGQTQKIKKNLSIYTGTRVTVPVCLSVSLPAPELSQKNSTCPVISVSGSHGQIYLPTTHWRFLLFPPVLLAYLTWSVLKKLVHRGSVFQPTFTWSWYVHVPLRRSVSEFRPRPYIHHGYKLSARPPGGYRYPRFRGRRLVSMYDPFRVWVYNSTHLHSCTCFQKIFFSHFDRYNGKKCQVFNRGWKTFGYVGEAIAIWWLEAKAWMLGTLLR